MTVVDFAAWYESAYGRVAGSLFALSSDADAAADATDEAFVRAFEHWDRVGAMDSPEGWTVVVGRNLLRRRARRRSQEAQLVRSVAGPGAGDAPNPDPTLWRQVALLPDRQRLAVVLRYVADLSEQQIASTMQVSRGTVAATLSAARKRLHPESAE